MCSVIYISGTLICAIDSAKGEEQKNINDDNVELAIALFELLRNERTRAGESERDHSIADIITTLPPCNVDPHRHAFIMHAKNNSKRKRAGALITHSTLCV